MFSSIKGQGGDGSVTESGWSQGDGCNHGVMVTIGVICKPDSRGIMTMTQHYGVCEGLKAIMRRKGG